MQGFFRFLRPRNSASALNPMPVESYLDDSRDNGISDLQRYSPDDVWARTSVSLDVADRFIGLAITEIKLRGVLEPLVLLPCRPNYELVEAKRFVHLIFYDVDGLDSAEMQREVKLSDVFVLMSALKWVWARIPGGVVTWDVYEQFKSGEEDAGRAHNAFKVIIPVAADSQARSRIIFNFFDLLSAIASHWKTTGMSGRKVARLAAWWAFPLSEHMARLAEERDDSSDERSATRPTFSEAYKLWSKAADASTHLFFGYLRAESASRTATLPSISPLPITLNTLLSSTPYPPKTSAFSSSTDALLLSAFVRTYSSTPRHILQRFYGLARRNPNVGDVSANDTAVERFLYASPSSSTDAVDDFLTDEFTRILNDVCSYSSPVKPISSNSTHLSGSIYRASKKSNISLAQSACFDEWSHFEDYGFWNDTIPESLISAADESEQEPRGRNASGSSKWSTESCSGPEMPSLPKTRSQFLSRRFPPETSPTLTNPEKSLPSAELLLRGTPRRKRGHQRPDCVEFETSIQQSLEIAKLPLDDAFWWTWLCAHGPEELSSRQAIFSAHVVVEFDAVASETSNTLSDLKNKDRFVIFEERLSRNSVLEDHGHRSRSRSRSMATQATTRVLRLASRSLKFHKFHKFHNRTESTVVAATAAAAVGAKLPDRPSLLSLYRERQLGNATAGALTVNVVSPGEDRVKSLREPVYAAASSARTDDGLMDLSWATSREPTQSVQDEIQRREEARLKQRASMVIDVEDVVSKALRWANSDRMEAITESDMSPRQPERSLPTPPSLTLPHRIPTPINGAEALEEVSFRFPEIAPVKKRGLLDAHRLKKLRLKASRLLRRETIPIDIDVPPSTPATDVGPSSASVMMTSATDAANSSDGEKKLGSSKVKVLMAKLMAKSGNKDSFTPSTESAVWRLPLPLNIDNFSSGQRSPVWEPLRYQELIHAEDESQKREVAEAEQPLEVSSRGTSMNSESEVEDSPPTSVEDMRSLIQNGLSSFVPPGPSISQKGQSPLSKSEPFPQPGPRVQANMLFDPPPSFRDGVPLVRSSSLAPNLATAAPRSWMTKRVQGPHLSPMPSHTQFSDCPNTIQPIFPSTMPVPAQLPPQHPGRRSPALGTPPPFPPPPVPHIDARRVLRVSQVLNPSAGHEPDIVRLQGVRSGLSPETQYPRRPSPTAVTASYEKQSEYLAPAASRWANINADARNRTRKPQDQQQQNLPHFIGQTPWPPLRNRPSLSSNVLYGSESERSGTSASGRSTLSSSTLRERQLPF
ncbi:hypothetical protein POJ06DRAFT_269290 [Lipomyces tetrasporus]|uniref:Meiotically up-regulated protein Msb1/Mug8 domain-containing protein n=1 Tax=Lipomyces tetrasporus TaxID=54092 RepID=A0AAD7QQ52_9ASCO|nr:uncharacterized protein POJ06DRAFT_269290 [Lipomyces tetrasporus]KAJ8099226.1 hypothetical protein POJ06DRAFT_269290 [Lipomyces tetrasporus]